MSSLGVIGLMSSSSTDTDVLGYTTDDWSGFFNYYFGYRVGILWMSSICRWTGMHSLGYCFCGAGELPTLNVYPSVSGDALPVGLGAILFDCSFPFSNTAVLKTCTQPKPFMPPRSNVTFCLSSSCIMMPPIGRVSSCRRNTITVSIWDMRVPSCVCAILGFISSDVFGKTVCCSGVC